MQGEKASAASSFKVVSDYTLLKLLKEEYSALENYEQKKFICLAAAKRLMTRDRILNWAVEHQLHQQAEERVDIHKVVDWIHAGSYLLFAALVLAQQERLTTKLFSHGFCDATLFDYSSFEAKCRSADLTDPQKEGLERYRTYVGIVFENDKHQDIPKDTVLPYFKREDLNKYGSFGVVYRMTVASGHLKGYKENIVAEKKIRAKNDRSAGEWRKLYREVETLRKRQHPNIVPLLASYYLEAKESSEYLRTLHLVFPWAETDLASWMTSSQIPVHLEGLRKHGRQAYLYRSICALVSGVSYLHREIEGTVTAHHDLKPRNILVIDGVLKIGDLGRSHLRPLIQGSATEGASELGTYEYQPPEYWNDDGTRARGKHGRAFDTWAMGCIIIELATLIVYDWKPLRVSKFKDLRQRNTVKVRKCPESMQTGADASFHNNWAVVHDWWKQLERDDGDLRLTAVLKVALGMLSENPMSRLHMWEAEVDLHNILTSVLNSYDNLIPELPQEAQCVGPSRRMYNNNHPERKIRDQFPDTLDGAQSPLHRAIAKENRARVVRLLELGWPLHLKDSENLDALDCMKINKDGFIQQLGGNITRLLDAARNGDSGMVKQLLNKGLTPLLADIEGRSALFEAALFGHVNVMECLLATKAKDQVSRRDPLSGRVPLHAAAAVGSIEALERILAYSPDINDCGPSYETPLSMATEGGHQEAVRVLLRRGAQVFPLHPQLSRKQTPVHSAAEQGYEEILELLLQAPDGDKCLEQKNGWEETPILLTINERCVGCFEILKRHGASLHAIPADGWTVLHKMADKGMWDLLKQHINDFNTDEINARTNGNQTPLMIAEDRGHKEVARLLKTHLKSLRRATQSTSRSGNESGVLSISGLGRMQEAIRDMFHLNP